MNRLENRENKVTRLLNILFRKEEKPQVITNKFTRLRQLSTRRHKLRGWINILTKENNSDKRLHAFYLLQRTNAEIRKITIQKTTLVNN